MTTTSDGGGEDRLGRSLAPDRPRNWPAARPNAIGGGRFYFGTATSESRLEQREEHRTRAQEIGAVADVDWASPPRGSKSRVAHVADRLANAHTVAADRRALRRGVLAQAGRRARERSRLAP